MTAKAISKERRGLFGLSGPTLIVLLFLAAVVLMGVILGVIRLVKGLGPTTNLNTGYPWGLWIAFDFFAVPLSAGAFTLAFVVHIFNKKRYHGIAHLALLAGFLGYLAVVLVLIMDIGRWDQFWSVLVPWRWNLHSFMFEVSMSITLYFCVLVLELIPVILGAFGLGDSWLAHLVGQLLPFIAGVGILLSTVHQASIGAVFLTLGHRLHPLWWSPIMPLHFLTSAVFSGLSVAIFLSLLTWRALKRPAPMKLLTGLAKAAAVVQGIFLLLKIGDLLLVGEIGLIFTSGRLSVLWWAEIIIGVVVPLAIYATRARESNRNLLAAASCVIIGLAINRSSVAWFALAAPESYTYTPYWMEFAIMAAAFSAIILFYTLGVRYLKTLRQPIEEAAH
jgi:Ni/Fe-hydrogenase subunit HybB-like protein